MTLQHHLAIINQMYINKTVEITRFPSDILYDIIRLNIILGGV